MGRPRKTDLASEWTSKIREREHEVNKRAEEWYRYLRHYRMDLGENESPPGDSVWVNYHFSLSRTILPSVYYRNPEVLVSPRRDTPIEYAWMLEKLHNWQLEEIDFETEARKVVFDTLFCGLGVLKMGFAPALQFSESKGEVDELAAFAEESAFSEMSSEKESTEVDQRVRDDMPFAIRVAPRYFLIDPLAADPKEARWVVHKILRPVDEVKKNKRYSRKIVSGIEGHISLRERRFLNEVPGSYNYYRDANIPRIYDNLVMLYEIWDMQKKRLIVLDSWNMEKGPAGFLRDEPFPYDIEGYPFELLVFNPDPESPYGISDAQTWFNPINALNLLNTMHYNHVKRYNRKYLYQKGSIPPDEMAKLQDPIDGAFAAVDGDPNSVVVPLQDATVTPDLYALREVLKAELVSLSGATAERREGGSAKAKTATEASIIEQQAKVRDSDRLYLVSKFVQNCVKKLLQLNRQFLDPASVSFVVGEELAMYWREVGSEILKSEVDIKVRIGSSGFVSREVKAKQYLDFLNLTRGLTEIDPMTGQPMPIVKVREVIRRVAEVLEIDRYDEILIPEQQQSATPPVEIMPEGGRGGPQKPALRAGAPNLGDLLSGVQNVGARRAPNPRQEIAR